MTDRFANPAAMSLLPSLAARRQHARKAADRHSRRVRLLRRGLMGAATLAVVTVVTLMVVDPFSSVVPGLSIENTALDGSKVTMTNPKLSGFRKDGKPYAIEASRAVQDVKAPTLFELHDLKARFVMGDQSVTHLTASLGTYNSTADTMRLQEGGHVVSETGLDVLTRDALVDFKKNEMTTEQPVSVTMPGRRITADSMAIRDGGKAVTFEGHVHSEWMEVPQAAAQPAPGPATP